MADQSSLGYWVRRFLLEYAASERNLSPNTCASYRDMLVLLLPFVAKRKRTAVDKLSVTDLSADVVRDFLAHLERDRNCSTATRNQRLASLRALARFIGAHSPEHVEWCAQIRMVPIKKGIAAAVTYLEKPEIDAMLAAPDQSSSQGARDHALLLFLYNAGARVSEAVSLRIGDVDWHNKSVRIIGKGNKERRCPLWAVTIERLRHLAADRQGDARLFLNRRGEPLTRYGVHTLVERYVARIGLSAPSLRTKRISPHVIRHTTATHLLNAGVDINTIRAWLGHVSIDTTSIYAETDLATKKRALATLDRGGSEKKVGGWSRQPEVMAFLRTL
ncbi:MAG: tyrosine-type recombinase/integrase [Hyphomicrobium sp.]|jgi:site-specific recombinase XerD